jgi:hypothetical protein
MPVAIIEVLEVVNVNLDRADFVQRPCRLTDLTHERFFPNSAVEKIRQRIS